MTWPGPGRSCGARPRRSEIAADVMCDVRRPPWAKSAAVMNARSAIFVAVLAAAAWLPATAAAAPIPSAPASPAYVGRPARPHRVHGAGVSCARVKLKRVGKRPGLEHGQGGRRDVLADERGQDPGLLVSVAPQSERRRHARRRQTGDGDAEIAVGQCLAHQHRGHGRALLDRAPELVGHTEQGQAELVGAGEKLRRRGRSRSRTARLRGEVPCRQRPGPTRSASAAPQSA